jgi:hypothetical protein
MIELKRFGGAPNGYPFAPLTRSYVPTAHPSLRHLFILCLSLSLLLTMWKSGRCAKTPLEEETDPTEIWDLTGQLTTKSDQIGGDSVLWQIISEELEVGDKGSLDISNIFSLLKAETSIK